MNTPLTSSPLEPQALNLNNETPLPQNYSLMESLKRLGQKIAEYFTSQSEIKVWQLQARSGKPYWRVYDPNTNRSATFGSEEEVRIWIEELFYQQQHQSIYRSTDYDYHRSNQLR
ncbi:hypothetical protein H6F42_01760 [Pseudanabaena sp. FACHB-1998]|uniref:hypothetical protein n=1 Tax=Pseudanabaena sp. FACHB-1998 TaxID=2692858 RepID=UPI001680A8D1|nr:hypothetical protein [Pseudanabaena sp. FACHB-1998]MBD2175644.1 hypothetical protein [Pseudanabaena sp. FACHB-1998]